MLRQQTLRFQRNRLPSPSGGLPLENRLLLAINLNTTDVGQVKNIGMYFMGPDNAALTDERAGEYIDGVRFPSVQEHPLEPDGSLSQAAQEELDSYIVKYNKLSNPRGVILLASTARRKVHSSYKQPGNSNKISGARWVDMFRAEVDYLNSQGIPVVALEPINESDFGNKLSSRADWNSILSKFQADPVLTNYPIIGPSTLNADNFNNWYNAMKDNVDWGATHWIGGSFGSWKNFITKVTGDGKLAFASEAHHLAELLSGAEYGLGGATFWQTIHLNEADFIKASEQGTRIAYKEKGGKAVAAAYKLNNENSIYLFAGHGPKGNTATFNFVFNDRGVTVDGQFVPAGQAIELKSSNIGGVVKKVTW